ncbi:MAG TPA: hypothetical protein VF532_19885, partial [Candidatus Angelobacter sp.]
MHLKIIGTGLLATGALVLLLLMAGTPGVARAGQSSTIEETRLHDCTAPPASLPAGATRVYIALRNGHDGSGHSAADARDGSTAAGFDKILRCYSEGCTDATDPKKSVARTENLIVCLGPGKFETKGPYDYLINAPHRQAEGFTIGKGWR